MWISKEEYDESGPSIVHRKCFLKTINKNALFIALKNTFSFISLPNQSVEKHPSPSLTTAPNNTAVSNRGGLVSWSFYCTQKMHGPFIAHRKCF